MTTLKHWFGHSPIREKRGRIAGIIRELAYKQFPIKSFKFPKISFSPASGSGYTENESGLSSDDDAESFGSYRSDSAMSSFGAELSAESDEDVQLPNGEKIKYRTHLNTGLVWYSNGRFVSGCQIVWYADGYHQKTRHPKTGFI